MSRSNANKKKSDSVRFSSTDASDEQAPVESNSGIPRKKSIFTVEKLNERYKLNQDFRESTMGGTWNYIKKYYKPTPAFFKRQLFKRIPFLDWIRHYNVKEWLTSDIVSGLTIGIVHIPQGMQRLSRNEMTTTSARLNRSWLRYPRGPASGDWSLRVILPGDSLRLSRLVTASERR